MIKKTWRDLVVILSAIWVNLILFLIIMTLAAVLLKLFGQNPREGWPQLFLDAVHYATIERVETGERIIPIILAFILPVLTTIILGEGILRVLSIYSQRRTSRKEWVLMIIKTFHNHTVICGLGEMGKHLLKRLLNAYSGAKIVLVDPRPGILSELGLTDGHTLHLQGDMADMEVLAQANIRNAKLVILTAGEDALNLETAYKIQKVNPAIPIWIRLHHSGLAELLDLSTRANIHFFCPYQQAAESIMDQIMEKKVV